MKTSCKNHSNRISFWKPSADVWMDDKITGLAVPAGEPMTFTNFYARRPSALIISCTSQSASGLLARPPATVNFLPLRVTTCKS